MSFRSIMIVLAVCGVVLAGALLASGARPASASDVTACSTSGDAVGHANCQGAVNTIHARLLPATCGRGFADIGDANCDGAINAVDASFVLQYAAGLIPVTGLCYFAAAEANDQYDLDVNAIDALLILQVEAGLLSHLPGGTGGKLLCIR